MQPSATLTDILPFDPSEPESIETLQVVFKIVERCNINCTYCYYFNMGETTALDRPATVTVAVARSLAEWLAQGCRELRIPKVLISFHGGEPMMMKPRNFGLICESFRSQISCVADLSFCMQTNGTILNDSWLELFGEYGVRLGISIDGDRAANDRYRLSRQGGSTFDRTENTLKRVTSWAQGNPRLMPSTISVIDCRNNYKRIYECLRGLGVEQMNFLLPDRNADQPLIGLDGSGHEYGKALYDVCEAWLTEDNPNVYIKYIYKVLGYFQLNRPARAEARDSPTPAGTRRARKEYHVIVARSDGTVAVNDSYMPALLWYKRSPVYSIFSSSLKEFLSDRVFLEIERAASTLPSKCAECKWKRLCRGGDLENRFSSKNGFDNPSVYCDGYQVFYQRVCDLLIAGGYPPDAMQRRLGLA